MIRAYHYEIRIWENINALHRIISIRKKLYFSLLSIREAWLSLEQNTLGGVAALLRMHALTSKTADNLALLIVSSHP